MDYSATQNGAPTTADVLALMRDDPDNAAGHLDLLEAALLDSPIPAAELMIQALENEDEPRALAILDRFDVLVEGRRGVEQEKHDLRNVVAAGRGLIPAGKYEDAIRCFELVGRLLADTKERPCMRPKRSCPTRDCEFRFVGDEGRDLWVCPECGAGRTLCRNRGEPYCRYHKGSSRRGTHGLSKRYEFSNQTIEELFEAQLEKGDLLNLEQDVALTNVRINILTRRMGWPDLNLNERDVDWFSGVAVRFQEALEAETHGRALDLAREAIAYVSKRIEESSAWHELERVQEHKRKLADTEAKRQAVQDGIITPERLVQFMITLSSVVEMAVARHLEDARARRRIVMDVGASVDHLLRGEPVPARMLPKYEKKPLDGKWEEVGEEEADE